LAAPGFSCMDSFDVSVLGLSPYLT
jgi:hypothetical protein